MNENQTPRSNTQNLHEDEIDLRELVNVIIRRKKLILGLFLALVIIAGGLSFLMPKTYESQAVIFGAYVNGAVINPNMVLQVITKDELLEKVINSLKINKPVDSLRGCISAETVEGDGLISIKVSAASPAVSQRIREEVINVYSDYENKFYLAKKKFYEDELSVINEEKSQVKIEASKTDLMIDNIVSLSPTVDPEAMSKILLLKNITIKYQETLIDLNERKHGIELILLNTKNFEVLRRYKPVKTKPKIKLNITLAGILSLMLGVFLAFFMEFWQKSK